MRTSAPNLSSSRINSPACSGARVTTMRFPANGWLALSNGPSRELQNPARSRIEQFRRDFATERLSFLLRTADSRSSSAHAFRAVGRQNTHASRTSSPSSNRPHAPSGRRQPPCKFASTVLSAETASEVGLSTSFCTKENSSSRDARNSSPSAP